MASNVLECCFHNKEIFKLSVKTGQVKVKKWDKEKKCKVETNELKTWKMQKFSISLGSRGRQPLGFIEVQYWGDKELKEGMLIRKGYYFLKQSKWEVKNPVNFITQKHAKHELVLTDFDCLIEKKDKPQYKYAKPKTPEESMKLGMQDYLQEKDTTPGLMNEDKEEMVDVNESFGEPILKLED